MNQIHWPVTTRYFYNIWSILAPTLRINIKHLERGNRHTDFNRFAIKDKRDRNV